MKVGAYLAPTCRGYGLQNLSGQLINGDAECNEVRREDPVELAKLMEAGQLLDILKRVALVISPLIIFFSIKRQQEYGSGHMFLTPAATRHNKEKRFAFHLTIIGRISQLW